MAWAKLRYSNAIALLLMSGLLLLNLRSGSYLKFEGSLLPRTKQRVEKAGAIVGNQIKTVLAQTATGCLNQKPFTVEQYAKVRALLKPGVTRIEIEQVLGAGCGIELDQFSWTATNGKKLIVQFTPDGKLKNYTFDKREFLSDV
ncbi:MAG: hypothetical protein ACM37W_23415 [Actinomycetota bacterium]